MIDEAKVTSALGVYQKCLEGRESAEANVQESLAQLRGAAESATFVLKGQWYQVRERKGRLYLCELDGKPKGRPKKTPEQKERDRIERERRRAEAAEAVRLEEEHEGGSGEGTLAEIFAAEEADQASAASASDPGRAPDRGDDAGELGSPKDGLVGPVIHADFGGNLRDEESGEHEIPIESDEEGPSLGEEEEE